MYFDDLAQSIDAFSKQPMDADPENLRDEAEGMLGLLFQECMKVREASNDYPRNPIRGDVWFRGSEIGLIAENLAIALKQRGFLDLEEHAHTARCAAILAVQSHYHNLVGPAMIARAECNERLENFDFAVQLYEAVIGDFTWIVGKWIDEPGAPPSDEDRCSIECLVVALKRTLALRPEAPNVTDRRAGLARAEAILARK